jgi:hypothetical protein
MARASPKIVAAFLEGHFVVLEVSRRLLWIPTELHAGIIREAPYERLTPALSGRCEQRERRSAAAPCSAISDPLEFSVGEATRNVGREGSYRERTTPLPDWRRALK